MGSTSSHDMDRQAGFGFDRQAGFGFGALHWVPWVTLIVACGLVLVAWRTSVETTEHHLQSEFDSMAGEIRLKLDSQIIAYTQILRASAAWCETAGTLDRAHWREFIQRQDLSRNYPAIQAVAYAQAVERADLPAFVEAMRRSGVPDFAVRPPGDRERYVVNAYTEPFVGGNIRALGYDMWQDANRRQTMEQAIADGAPQITERTVLKIDERENPVPAFIMYLPVFRDSGGATATTRHLAGFVLSPFRMPVLMRDVIGVHETHISFAVYDGEGAGEDRLFFASAPLDEMAEAHFTRRESLSVGGRTWTLFFASRPEFENHFEAYRPRVVLAVGGVVTLLLFVTAWQFVTTRRRALALADRMTASLRDSEEQFRNLFDNVNDAIFVHDLATGSLTRVNRRTCEMYGATEQYILDHSFVEASSNIPPYTGADALVWLNKAITEGPQMFEWQARRLDDGSLFWTEVSLRRARIGDQDCILAVVRDISARKQAQEALHQKNIELERSNEELEAFAYVASHDLREPLRTVVNYSALLAKRLGGRLDLDERDYLKFLQDAARRMDSLVRDLLNFSRVGRLCDPMAPAPVRAMVDAALNAVRAALDEAGAKVEISSDLPTVLASRDEIERLFQNLIDNAIKYRLPGVPLKIAIGCSRQGSLWRFEVRDNGVGIEPGKGYEERVFELFERLHKRDDFGGGTGIGLAIARKIVERHGGHIWVASPGLGQGTAFFFTLPVLAGERHDG